MLRPVPGTSLSSVVADCPPPQFTHRGDLEKIPSLPASVFFFKVGEGAYKSFQRGPLGFWPQRETGQLLHPEVGPEALAVRSGGGTAPGNPEGLAGLGTAAGVNRGGS